MTWSFLYNWWLQVEQSVTVHLFLTVSQVPMSISLKKVNSSAEITCSCSLSYLIVFKLQRRFHGNEPVVFLSLENGEVTKNTIAEEFTDRINIQQIEGGYGFTLELSLLRLEDTDLYYCNWIHMESEKLETVSSNGTIIIVRGERTSHLRSICPLKMSTHKNKWFN